MTRLDDWQTNLSALITARMFTPYDIINFNCLKWACEAIEAVTGVNNYVVFENQFSTDKGAIKALKKIGKAETCSDFVEGFLGDKKPLAFLRKGDIVCANVVDMGLIIPTNIEVFGPCLGVCYGRLSYFVGETGLAFIDTLQLGQDSYGFHC